MKITLLVIGSVVLLVLAVIAIGILLPKHHVATRSAKFRARPEQLFALIAGPPTWRPDVKHYELIPNPGGPEMWRETNSQGETIAYQVVERNAPTLLKTRITTPNLPYSGSWSFALHDDGGSTTVRITEEGDVYNPVFRFVSQFVIGHTSSINAYLANLAKALGEDVKIQD